MTRLDGIADPREIQLISKPFDAVADAGGTVGTQKSQVKPFNVPKGKFWFPVSCWMFLEGPGAIIAEEYRVQILEPVNSSIRTQLLAGLAVDASQSAVWPMIDQRSGAAYHGLPPQLMTPGEKWNFTVNATVLGNRWIGRFNYYEIIGSNANRAYELFFQAVAGTRELSMQIRPDRVRNPRAKQD